MSRSLWVPLALVLSAVDCVSPQLARAADVEFTATVDQTTVSTSDLVTLTISMKSNGPTVSGDPQFSAPDFETVNTYNSHSQNFAYDSTTGAIQTVKQQQFTRVLHPMKVGTLRITGIQAKVGGQVLKAADIEIKVSAGSSRPQGNPPQGLRGYSRQQGRSMGQPPAEDESRTGAPAFLKAVVSRTQAYKGEQLTVSYYLYHRARVFNIQVDKYPILSGFLREDLDMPMMGQRLDSERVVEGGVAYERALLARYAAYPLQAGDLEIDSLSLKYNYYLDAASYSMGEVDPFFGFFHQMAPRLGSAKSDIMKVKVSPLPVEGRPESFVGGVGDFSVSTAVDKYEVRENEAVTVTLKVEGRGNAPAIEEPKKKWPTEIEFYDSKGRSQVGKNGVGEKIFEFLLIPRASGKITLPPLELGFFNPDTGRYYTKSTEPILLNVLPPAPGSASVPSIPKHAVQGNSVSSDPGLAAQLKIPLGEKSNGQDDSQSRPIWPFLYWGFFIVLAFLGLLIGFDFAKKAGRKVKQVRHRRSEGAAGLWNQWKSIVLRAGTVTSMKEIRAVCSEMGEWVFDFLDSSFHLGVRSMPREELKELLVEQKKVPREYWEQLQTFLEYADTVRFSGMPDDSGAESGVPARVREDLLQKAKAVEGLFKSLEQLPKT